MSPFSLCKQENNDEDQRDGAEGVAQILGAGQTIMPMMTNTPFDQSQNVFRLCSGVVSEGFEDGALVLRLKDRHLLELDPTAERILELTDGKRDAAQVAVLLQESFQITNEQALQDTLLLYEQLSTQDIVEITKPGQSTKENTTVDNTLNASSHYIINPDVVLREEDEDGGLLFNPDTNQIKVVNTTGLFIWKKCDGSYKLDEIVVALQKAFEEAPTDQITEDVNEFIEEMVNTGFIGTVEESKEEK